MNKSCKKFAKALMPILLVTSISLSGCQSVPASQKTNCVATEPVLSAINSYSNVQVAVVDSDTLEVVGTFEVPPSTSITLINESDLAELARYTEELRQCSTTNL